MTPLEQVIVSGNRAESTKGQYLVAARDFVGYASADPTHWTPLKVEEWCRHLHERRGLHPRTVGVYLAGLRYASKRWSQLFAEGHDFAAPVELPRMQVTDPETMPLTIEECRALMAACEVSKGRLDPRGLRDRAILLLGLHAALRRSEMANLTLDHVRGGAEEGTVTVLAKGARWHTVEVAGESWEALTTWRAWLWRRDIREGAVFRGLRAGIASWVVGEGLSDSGLYKALLRRAEVAGVEDFHPHRLRHTFVTMAREAGWEDWQINQVTGHRSGAAIDRYTHHRGGALGATFPKLG